jgi:histone acetyltransferase
MDEDTDVGSRKRKAEEVSDANGEEADDKKDDESSLKDSNEETKDNRGGDAGGDDDENKKNGASGEEKKSEEAAQEDEKETPGPEEEEDGGEDDGDDGEEEKIEATDPVEPAEKPKKDDKNGTSNPYDSLKYIVITNDGKPENMIKLVALKSLFAKQLPKMPRAYIARLVFDRKHTSLAILSEDPALKDTDEEVIGSICYRAFPEMRFAEIAFCAVNASHQVKVRTFRFGVHWCVPCAHSR